MPKIEFFKRIDQDMRLYQDYIKEVEGTIISLNQVSTNNNNEIVIEYTCGLNEVKTCTTSIIDIMTFIHLKSIKENNLLLKIVRHNFVRKENADMTDEDWDQMCHGRTGSPHDKHQDQ